MSGRVVKVFSDILGMPADSLNDESSPDNTPKWDSTTAIDLTLALEDEFNVKLTTREITAMRNIAAVKRILREKGAADV